MGKYILLRDDLSEGTLYVRELHGDDSYTDDIGNALEFESETLAFRELIDDEKVAKLLYDIDGGIEGYEIIED